MRFDLPSFFRNNTYIFLTVFGIGLIAHGYCYFNMNFSHDSLFFDHTYSLYLGRWGQNVIYKLRGEVFPPVLVGTLSLFFLSLAVIIFCKIFEIQNKYVVTLISGVFVTNFSYTYIAATYLFFLDINILALMLALLAVYICKKSSNSLFCFSSVPLLFSISLYQAYLQVFAVTVVLVIIDEIIKNTKNTDIVKLIVKFSLIGFISLIFYYISLKIIHYFGNVEYSSGYNSINNAGIHLNIIETLKSIYNDYFHLPSYSYRLQKVILIACTFFSIFFIITIGKIKQLNIISIIICFVIYFIALPFASNCVYIISGGLMHALMKYSYSFIFLVPCILYNEYISLAYSQNTRKERKHNTVEVILFISLFCFIFNNIIFSNQVYWLKDLQTKASISFMTRVLTQLDNLKNYSPETKTCFAGSVYNNKFISTNSPIKFEKIETTGLTEYFSFTYSFPAYIQNHLRMNYNIGSDCQNIIGELKNKIDKMPIFPINGSVNLIEGTAIIKISERLPDNTYGSGVGN